MHAGLPKFVPVNLKDIVAAGFQEGDEISLESLKEKGLINPSGRERKLPLKVLSLLPPSQYVCMYLCTYMCMHACKLWLWTSVCVQVCVCTYTQYIYINTLCMDYPQVLLDMMQKIIIRKDRVVMKASLFKIQQDKLLVKNSNLLKMSSNK